MKKLVLFAAVFTVVIGGTSCNKGYTCECTDTKGKVTTREIVASNRVEAQKNCDEYGLLGSCEIR